MIQNYIKKNLQKNLKYKHQKRRNKPELQDNQQETDRLSTDKKMKSDDKPKNDKKKNRSFDDRLEELLQKFEENAKINSTNEESSKNDLSNSINQESSRNDDSMKISDISDDNISQFRKTERTKDRESRRKRRSDISVKTLEQEINTLQKRKKLAEKVEYDKLANIFNENIKDGPIHCCSSCDRLWFKKSIREMTREKLISREVNEHFIDAIVLEDHDNSRTDQTYIFCKHCAESF